MRFHRSANGHQRTGRQRITSMMKIRDNMLGWDITDYGLGKFDEVGFALITIRNGNVKNEKYTKSYAEKLLMVQDGQMAPMHFH